jgi:hypothetical protein
MAPHTDDRSIGELFAELSRDTRTLIQQEVRLAKTELAEKAGRMKKGAGFLVGGGLLAYGGLLAIVAALILGLADIGLPGWAAALVGGIVAAGGGSLLVRVGLAALRPQALLPHQTVETLKEDAQWLKNETRG